MNSQWSLDNRILALGLGLSVLGLYTIVNLSLRSIRDAQKVEPPVAKPQYIDQKTEDALMPETLQVLLSSPNKGISAVAARIVLDRVVHDKETVMAVLKEVQRRDRNARERALRALTMLVTERKFVLGMRMSDVLTGILEDLKDTYVPHVIKAVVDALVHNVDENKYDVYDPYNDTFGDRDDTERKALVIVQILDLKRPGAAKILLRQTRFIHKWLLRQNWGATDDERKENFAHFVNMHRYQGHSTLSIVMAKLCNYAPCVQLLVELELLKAPEDIGLKIGDHEFTTRIDDGGSGQAVVSIEIPDSFAAVAMENPDAAIAIVQGALAAATQEAQRREANGETGTTHVTLAENISLEMAAAGASATRTSASAPLGVAARTIEQSDEERSLRRRNREVMVLNDGMQPLGADDIIEGTRTRNGL